MRLAGKVAVITGAASGIGRATAALFAREGARLVLADVNEQTGEELAETFRAQGGEAVFVQTDVTSEADVQRMVAAAVERFGRLDILFNNAGIVRRSPVAECTLEEWEQVFAVNVRGVFLGCKHAVPVMQKQGGGVIVNTGSGASFIASPNSPAYTASKGAVLQLTKQVAVDYAKDGIRVNAVCPGVVDTPLMAPAFARGGDTEAGKAAFAAKHPLGRLAKADEVAKAVLFLASDESSFSTGSALMVDGGYTAQ